MFCSCFLALALDLSLSVVGLFVSRTGPQRDDDSDWFSSLGRGRFYTCCSVREEIA